MARVATFQSGLRGFKVVYILRACMSVFDDPASLRGQSFGYALAPLDPLAEDSETFVEATRLGLFIDEQGEGHVSGPLRLYAPTDPIDCDEVPTFSKGNLFIEGIERVISTVPTYGIILWDVSDEATNPIPPGWVRCDGKKYILPDGSEWVASDISALFLNLGDENFVAYIQKLPEGAVVFG